MLKAQIVTWWIGTDDWHLTQNYTIQECSDVSMQPVPVNTPVVVEIITEQSTMDAILNDPNYGVGAVLWLEEIDL